MTETETETESIEEAEAGAGPDATVAATPVAGESPAEDAPSREQELEEELSRSRDQLLRTAADFDNFRKRTRKDVEDAQRKGLERALLEMLPIADNLERALQAVDGATDVNAIVEGVEMVLRSFGDALERLGVERVPTTGVAFDPNLHEAIQQVPSADAAPGTVVQELMPGYRLGTRLLRAAMVAVATAKAAQAEPADAEETR